MTDTLPLSIQPVISYPKEAEVGKTYLMEIDLQMPESGFEWHYEEEEYLIYCMVNAGNLFTVTSIGEPVIVLHRFGGTYGAARFLLEAVIEESMGKIKITLVNSLGVPIRVIDLPKIQIRSELSDISISSVRSIKVTDLAEEQAKEEISHTPTTPATSIREINPSKILTKEKISHTPSNPIKSFSNQKKYTDTHQNTLLFGDKPVVVTMLGSSGSGKTCYLSAMYARMTYANGLNGYWLKTSKHSDGRELLNIWEKMVKGKDLHGRRFPESTQESSEYTFTLNYAADKSIINFDWLDIRGEAISDVDEDPSRQKLVERLKKTDCLMLCISGEYFKEPITDNNKEEIWLNADAHFINYLIGELPRSENNTPPSIAIIVTQYDLCKEREANAVFEDVKQIFPIFFESRGWFVMVCVTTLGLELAEDISAPIRPINVQVPITFSLLTKMMRTQWEKIDQVQLNSKRNNRQNPSIREAFRNVDSSKFQTSDNNGLKLAREMKEEIRRLSRNILTPQTNTLRFSTYLDGKEVSWKDILG